MKDDLRYTPSDCFETFPFPIGWDTHSDLEAAGKEYYEFRAALMIQNNEGLTKTYNRFHDPDEPSPDIAKLRRLHDTMDRAILSAYGWSRYRNRLPNSCSTMKSMTTNRARRKSPGGIAGRMACETRFLRV